MTTSVILYLRYLHKNLRVAKRDACPSAQWSNNKVAHNNNFWMILFPPFCSLLPVCSRIRYIDKSESSLLTVLRRLLDELSLSRTFIYLLAILSASRLLRWLHTSFDSWSKRGPSRVGSTPQTPDPTYGGSFPKQSLFCTGWSLRASVEISYTTIFTRTFVLTNVMVKVMVELV